MLWPPRTCSSRKQLVLYLERNVKPRRAQRATKLSLVLLSTLFAWRDALSVVKPETLIRWHQKGFRLSWKWKSKPRGRPRVPVELQKLITEMANENPTWGEERIAAELLLNGDSVSPRTVRRFMPDDVGPRRCPSSQRWATFVRNHAQARLACDFFVTVTASFRVLYVFLIMEVGRRRITHFNVTAHPTADWTLRQFREVITGEKSDRFLIHDRDSVYSSELPGTAFLRTTVWSDDGVQSGYFPVNANRATAFRDPMDGRAHCPGNSFPGPYQVADAQLPVDTWRASVRSAALAGELATPPALHNRGRHPKAAMNLLC